jgi:peptidoglycan hydrolase CwlO-like protein
MANKKPLKLVAVLEEKRPAIESALADAEQELAELNDRRAELEAVIARARSVLADDVPAAAMLPERRRTLHEAMALVLREQQNRWMTVHELADAVNRRALYEKRDRSAVDPSQIHARANKYPHIFEKNGSSVRLRSS